MKTITKLLLLPFFCCIVGCSRNYDVNFPASQSDASGEWLLSAAPQAVTNHFSSAVTASLTLLTNGTALYVSIPVETNVEHGTVHSNPSQWVLISGAGTWTFSDIGHTGWHIWAVNLFTQTNGIQLILGKQAGKLMLVYEPDSDSPEQVVFRHAQK